MNEEIKLIKQETCPKCQTPIGRIIRYKNKPYFDDGLMLVLIGLKRCHACGRMYYWNGEQVNIEKIEAKTIPC